jgi:raffinose/stachyose/melibiose transport system permease protein
VKVEADGTLSAGTNGPRPPDRVRDRPDQRVSRKRRAPWIAAAVVYLFTFVVALPVLWTLLLSFETNNEILEHPFSLSNISLNDYHRVFATLQLFTLYKNTLVLALFSVSIGVAVTFMLSFALSRMVFRHPGWRTAMRYFFLAGLAVPVYVLLFPVYRLDIEFHVYGTYLALILPYVAGAVPFNTLLFTGFLADFPGEVEEAAIVDGCTLYRMLRRVTFPMMKPVVLTVVVFNALYVWNEFPFAVTLIQKSSLTTVALGVSQFQGFYYVDYGAMMAASTLVLIPQLVLYALFQRQIVAGMTLGAVKA